MLLDWDLDMGFSAEIHSWLSRLSRTSTGCYLSCTSSHRWWSRAMVRAHTWNTWSQQQTPHFSLWLGLNLKDLGFGEWCCPAPPSLWILAHVMRKVKAGESNTAVTPMNYQRCWQPPLHPSYLHTLWLHKHGVWSGSSPARGQQPRSPLCLWENSFYPLPQAVTSKEGNCEHWG